MSPTNNPSSDRVCPTCGTRLSDNTTRCLVCGRTFASGGSVSAKAVAAPRMPEITLSLPVALGIMVLVLAIGAAVVFFLLRSTGRVIEPTLTPTVTQTATITPSPSPTPTNTPMPTFTPLPPIEYEVKAGDLCGTIALFFNVSIQSIVLENNLPPNCGILSIGQKLLIPQPTPTASPMPTATLSEIEKTDAACEQITYTVRDGDTLSGIARSYNVSIESLREYNGLATDMVYGGQPLIIPLCARKPTPGPTPTATPPPLYPAPNLLLPADGTAFLSGSDVITLQWASVGTLRENESYSVTIEDVTDGGNRKMVQYATDTKLIVPTSFRPSGSTPHIVRWWVMPVRQTGTGQDGRPIWQPAGAASIQRVFSWVGGGASTSP